MSDCELVVLSACDTQRGVKVGDSEMALPWGFMYAGAPTVIASLWQVDDTATTLLMGRLYGNLLGQMDQSRSGGGRVYAAGDSMPKADALQEAKDWLRKLTADEVKELTKGKPASADPRGTGLDLSITAEGKSTRHPFDHPYYWAAFILIGAPE